MLWVDKHSPREIEELSIHPDVSRLLLKQAASPSLPHLLFYGPTGAGKKTRVLALARRIFGSGVDKVKVETFTDRESGTEATVCRSSHHILLSCQEFGLKDRAIVQSIIKDIAESTTLSGVSSFFAAPKASNVPSFKICIFQDADLLSEGAQHALRRTLEIYSSRLKFVFLVERLERFSAPLKSRCFCVRVPLPSHREVVTYLRSICDREGLTPEMAPDALLQTISEQSGRNLRRAGLALECIATHNFTAPLSSSLSIPRGEASPFPLPWERLCDEAAVCAFRQQNPVSLSECRGMLYDLLAVLIPGELILMRLLATLLALLKKESPGKATHSPPPVHAGVSADTPGALGKPRKAPGQDPATVLVHAAAHFSHTLKKGSKEIIHLEAFLAQAMRVLHLAGVNRT
ncbi:putative replication factor c [Neospora caninum Liverpool]|uniref:Putative replication factor c n=1 Tax=Neospora caninum (strain Liverpool) TaxID=572307 RepID=F0VIN1_NEOCL|nr:putative replication factor c [Neospora caninum Liverpool]CBZ53592.1 putative replication factor c [Neospora caninum Liverpool]CEL67581.1 TPA: replication factor c, putative [Neospora caninum Liverpool]|eukprot:XP_003883624.1 putative replication factor c [Neospora caninum Liverpool]